MSEEKHVDTSHFAHAKKPHPLIASLPAHLKDPENFDKFQKLIYESLASKHSHGDIMEWGSCASCQKRFCERGAVLKKIGFKSAAQYMVWKRTHEMIKSLKRNPLAKYDE